MDGWITEFYITFAKVRPNKQAGITVMRRITLVARMKLPSNMAAPGNEPRSRGQELRMLTTELRPQAPILVLLCMR